MVQGTGLPVRLDGANSLLLMPAINAGITMKAEKIGAYSAVEPLVIGLGVEKAATTWIHRQLESHPEIATTYTKEVGYWTNHYKEGPQWYSRQFNRTSSTKVYAEYTPHYISCIESVCQRVSSHVGDAKFILALRNPYERTFSAYLDALRMGATSLPFELACTPESTFVKKSIYSDDIMIFLSYYDIKKLHVILFDDIADDPGKVITNLYKFIGVSEVYNSDQLFKKVNAGSNVSIGSIYLKKLERLAKRIGLSRKHFMSIGMGDIVDRSKSYLSKKNPKPILTNENIEYLHQFFESDLLALSKILGRNFSSWDLNAARGI